MNYLEHPFLGIDIEPGIAGIRITHRERMFGDKLTKSRCPIYFDALDALESTLDEGTDPEYTEGDGHAATMPLFLAWDTQNSNSQK